MLFTLFAASCFLAQGVLAQYPLWAWWDPQALAQFLFPGMNPEWLRIPDVLYYVILPFIAAFTVIYGLLKELRIFRNVANKVNIVLAFVMAFMLLPSGVLTYIVTIFYAGSAFVGMMAFGIVFLVGIIIWAYGTSYRIWSEFSPETIGKEVKGYNKKLVNLERRRIEIRNEMRLHPNRGAALSHELVRVNNEITDTETTVATLRRQLQT